jgi:unsaturated chondroitin disaccharide hydrolase
MNPMNHCLAILFSLLSLSSGFAQTAPTAQTAPSAPKMGALTAYVPQQDLLTQIDANLKLGAAQYKYLLAHTPDDRMPRSYTDSTQTWVTSDPGWWTSGFHVGTLLQLYQATNDKALLDLGLKRLEGLNSQQYNKGTHDLGFMMYCSYGWAERIKPTTATAEVLMNSARSLSTRFNPKVGCIKSWDHGPGIFPVIIDNMMNLELLCWASEHAGDTSFLHIARVHANTTMINHYRPDYSSYHVVIYDTATGAVIKKQTAQGYADESAWARGQSWGLYGFTVMYRFTKDQRYLDQARHIAQYLLHQPNLPADGIPYWDYNAPDIPHALRDASAASIMASAFLELCHYVPAAEGKSYVKEAETILRTLSKPLYLAAEGTNGGYLLKHSVGHMPAHSEIDVPLTYADYYFVEAMMRYKNLDRNE